MQKAVIVVLILFYSVHFNAQDKLTKAHQETITEFIGFFKNNDRHKIAANVSYPLKREYPLPEIKSKVEFLDRFNEVFDSKLINTIVNSNPLKEDDWSAVGWRGIMLGNGDLWLDYDGTLLAINYQSAQEVKKSAELIASEKKTLHPSVNKFYKPIAVLNTKKFRIRIDDLGQGRYRYASWSKSAKISDKPDLIIENGEFSPDGSGGNHHYTFKNGKFIYECGIVVIGEENSSPAYLTIYKSGKEILSESADLVQY